MAVTVENAGAERGALILKQDQELRSAAEISSQGGVTLPPQATPIEHSQDLPAALVQYVVRTERNVILQDAASEGAFTKDPTSCAEGRSRSSACPSCTRGPSRASSI